MAAQEKLMGGGSSDASTDAPAGDATESLREDVAELKASVKQLAVTVEKFGALATKPSSLPIKLHESTDELPAPTDTRAFVRRIT